MFLGQDEIAFLQRHLSGPRRCAEKCLAFALRLDSFGGCRVQRRLLSRRKSQERLACDARRAAVRKVNTSKSKHVISFLLSHLTFVSFCHYLDFTRRGPGQQEVELPGSRDAAHGDYQCIAPA